MRIQFKPSGDRALLSEGRERVILMKKRPMINDINLCLDQARGLAHGLQNTRHNERELVHCFISLAGDEIAGLLAFGIWRGRAGLISGLRSEPPFRYDGVARARHAQL